MRSRNPNGASSTGTGAASNTTSDRVGSYRALASESMRSMGAPEVAVDGEVIEADPPHKLVQTWRMCMDDDMAAEGFTRLSYDIKAIPGGVTSLTVTHELEGAPALAQMVRGEMEEMGAGGGHAWILSDLKSLLETGAPMDMGDGFKQ